MSNRERPTKPTSSPYLVTWLTLLAFCLPLVGACTSHTAYVHPKEMPALNGSFDKNVYNNPYLQNADTLEGRVYSVRCVNDIDGDEECIEGNFDAYVVMKDGTETKFSGPISSSYSDTIFSIQGYDGWNPAQQQFKVSEIKYVDVHDFSFLLTVGLCALITGGVVALAMIPDWGSIVMD